MNTEQECQHLEELRREIDKLNETLSGDRGQLVKDSARYRALKEMAVLSDMPGYEEIVYSIVIPTGVDRASHVFRGKPLPDIDAAIDAAMR